ncbi:hypothetical protein THAR02_10151 [Trichoderma harzianum]|uniref:C3H1-type domain-containing protein n=1 Tax=Trichoderma harzianum TaxID=5544 RepID=A0A0F9WZ83_TRIHA|nr:hypothetical protein THAR02_10151 [Trichoderma harzianum]
MERQMGLNHRQHHSFSGYFIQGFGQSGRDEVGQQLVAYPIPHQQQHQVSFSTAGAGAAAAAPSRGLSSNNWRVFCPDGNVSPPSMKMNNATHGPVGMSQVERRGIAQPPAAAGAVSDGYAYYLSRGNGELTRLVPADMLPALNEIPPREPERRGMVVLPPLRGIPPKGMADMSQTVTVKNQIDRIVATSPSIPKKNKVYCDMWIHEGRCAFTQTGCKFKHEMPLDEASQKALGLFQGLPAWYKKQQEELNLWKSRDASDAETSPTDSSSHNEFAWQNPKALGTTVPDKSKLDTCHPSQSAKSRVAQFVWGPIGPPNKQAADKDPWGKEFGNKMYDGEAVSSFSSEGRRG